MTWTTNTTLEDIAKTIRGAKRIALVTHTKPDGDALGSTIAVARAINRARGVSGVLSVAECWYTGPIPTWYTKLVLDTKTRVIDDHNPPPAHEPDAILIMDTGSWVQMGALKPWLETRTEHTMVVDHHLQGDEDISDARFVETSAAAACEPAATLCSLLLRTPTESLPPEIAEPLYLGIATDTGWFRHSNVTPRTLRTAAALREAGADASRLYRITEQCERPSRLLLMGRALSSLRFDHDGRVATMVLRHSDVVETHAVPGESGGFADMMLTVEQVEVAAVLSEVNGPEPLTKVSLRSKSADEPIDVNAIARQFGGGGHRQAAGARIEQPIDDARDALVKAIGDEAFS